MISLAAVPPYDLASKRIGKAGSPRGFDHLSGRLSPRTDDALFSHNWKSESKVGPL